MTEAGGEFKSIGACGDCMAGEALAGGGQPEEASEAREGLGHNGTDRNEAGGDGHVDDVVDMWSESPDGS